MNLSLTRRRLLIKSGLVLGVLGGLLGKMSVARARTNAFYPLPVHIQAELVRLYGDRANYILSTARITLAAPQIAENNMVIPIKVTGDMGWVNAFTILVEKNPKPVAAHCMLLGGTDLDVALRIRIASSSDIYLVAETREGLVGVRTLVKYTIGCGEA